MNKRLVQLKHRFPAMRSFFITKGEPLFFYILVATGLIPLLVNSYFVTLDGPSHLYNGSLVRWILSGAYPEINNLYRLNAFPVPNSLVHFLFGLFSLFLPDYLTEKAVILLYLFFTPLIFRWFILTIAPANKVFSWFMILFVHNQNFYFGFFNLSFGILLLFLTFLYYIKTDGKMTSRKVMVIGGLLLLTYFSHLMVFLISVLFLLILSFGSVDLIRRPGDNKFLVLKNGIRNTFPVVLASLPALILTLLFFRENFSMEQHSERIEFSRLLEWILDIRPLLALRYGFPWKSYTYLLFALLVVMILFQCFTQSGKIRKHNNAKPGNPRRNLPVTLLIFTAGSLVLFLVLPNALLLSERIILFFFIFLVTLLAILEYPAWIHITAAIILIVFHSAFTRMYTRTMSGYSKEVTSMKEVLTEVKAGSVVLPLNYKGKWIFMHISGYAGTGKPLALLENYEAGLTWFPVRWNYSPYQIDSLERSDVTNKLLAYEEFINPEMPYCYSLADNDNHFKPIPYVLIFKDGAQEESVIPGCIRQILDSSYVAAASNQKAVLYKLR